MTGVGRVVHLALAAVVAAGVALTAQTVGDGAWPVSRPPRPLPARDVVFPPYEIRTLPNGLRVVTVLQNEQPVVSLRLLVGAGAAQDPAGKPGVASLTAALLDQGTRTRSAVDLADTIDYVGGGLGTGAGTDLSYVNVLVMKDAFDLALDLLSDVARNPAFAPEELERQRQQVLSSLTVSYQDPDYVARMVADRLVFGFHPYGMPSNGTPESVAAIGRGDLVRFHETWFAPNNAILAIVGDVTTEEAFRGAERALGGWQAKDLPLQAFTDPPDPTRRVIVVDRPGAVQTEIRIANLGLPRKHADYQALDLATKILGGEGANRLQRVLRSERSSPTGRRPTWSACARAGPSSPRPTRGPTPPGRRCASRSRSSGACSATACTKASWPTRRPTSRGASRSPSKRPTRLRPRS